jgi:hypothetical protein
MVLIVKPVDDEYPTDKEDRRDQEIDHENLSERAIPISRSSTAG